MSDESKVAQEDKNREDENSKEKEDDLKKQKELIKEEAEDKDSKETDDDISWEDAEDDLKKQKELIKEEAEDESREVNEESQPFTSLEGKKAGNKGKKKTGPPNNLDLILDVTLQVKVELGRTSMTVNDLLQLGPGSIVELTKMAGEPLSIFVNEKEIARGEVVVINEKFGIRLTDILNPIERVNQLK